MNNLVVRMSGISKVFPGTIALDGVDLSLTKGEVLGLIGANGAGKSTLVNVLAGILKPDSGTIEIHGEQIEVRSPREAQLKGIAFVQQEIATFATLTVAENIFIQDFPTHRTLLKRGEMRTKSREMLDRLGCYFGVDDDVETLSTGDRQMVTIARALMSNPSVLILDEPTSSLSVNEKNRLMTVVKQLRDQGVTFIFISHYLSEVFSICDRIVVMRNGVVAGSGTIAEVTMQQAVEWMIGAANSQQPTRRSNMELGDVALDVRNLNRLGVLDDVSFQARRGEVVGVWGLMGSGRTELARALVGLDPVDSGTVAILEGSELLPKRSSRRRNLFGYVPEDRRQEGLFLPLSVKQNIGIVGLKGLSRFGLVLRKKENSLAEQFIKRLGIRVSNMDQQVRTLSGGNQQKVVLARWVAVGPPVYVLDEPMRGLDIGAKAQIRELISELASAGMTIVVIDSELSELKLVADRYIVMRRGRVVAELGHDADEHNLMSVAAGAENLT